MTDHANELRRYSRKIGHPAGDVPSVMLAAAEEIERLAARLEAAEKSDAESIAMYRKARDERDALRAKIAEMEKQGPIGEIVAFGESLHEVSWIKGKLPLLGAKLYALPGAQGE